MSKFFKKCFWFLFLVIGLNLIYLFILVCFSPEFKKIYEISKFQNQNFEILVLGNSMALDGIDAGYLTQNGMGTYNLSVAGGHVSTSLLILEDYLKRNQKPNMVILGLSSAIGKSYLNPVPYKNPEVEFFYHPDFLRNFTNPPLLNFQWLAVDILKILISKDHRNAKMIQGQWQTQKVIADNSVFNNTNTKPIDYKDPYLLKIITLCESKGIKIILAELPGSNCNRNNFPFLYSIRLKNKKTSKLYNLNNYEVSQNIIDSKKDWLAHDHLNQKGAQRLTAFVYENILKKHNKISKN